MENDLIERRNKILKEIEDNNKDPEKLATTKGQNLQNLENTKKRNEELNLELEQSEDRYNSINKNVKEIQEKLATLREGKARNEATLEGIEARRKDLFYSISNELNIDNERKLLNLADLDLENLPQIEDQKKVCRED